MTARLHALLIGISDYPHLHPEDPPDDRNLGLRPLESAALSAYRVAKWLESAGGFAQREIGTIRTLLAPSPREIEAEPALTEDAAACTFDRVFEAAKGWRHDANSDRDGFALFYFAGHGVLRTKANAHALLLQDFANGVGTTLRNAIDTELFTGGMCISDSFPNLPRHQMFVFDACQLAPAALDANGVVTVGSVFDPVETTNAQKAMMRQPVAHTATEGTHAFGLRGKHSAFCHALLRALDASAIRPKADDEDNWEVTLDSLQTAIGDELDRLYRERKIPQVAKWHDVASERLVLRSFATPPEIEVTIEVDPEAAHVCTSIEIVDDADHVVKTVPSPLEPHPVHTRLPAGMYRAASRIEPQTDPYVDVVGRWKRIPPNQLLRLKVG